MSHDIGDPAPDFELAGTSGTFRLSDHLGERVVLLFYPGDNTPVCTKQFCSYSQREEDMSALDAVVVGINEGDVASHEAWAARNAITIPLLSDAGKKVAKAYKIKEPITGRTRRAAVIVDEAGRIAFRRVHTLGLDFLSADQLAEALEGLGARA